MEEQTQEEIKDAEPSQSSQMEVKPESKESETPEEPKVEVGNENVGMAVIAYLFFFIPLLTDSKNDPFVKFHVKQGLLLFCFSMAFYILRFFPFLGRVIYVLSPLISIAELAFLIIGIMNALNRKKKELPWIGSLAEKWFKF